MGFLRYGNHIHFLIKPGEDGGLLKIMQWIKCNFAKAWNKERGRKDHVWGERFHSRIINGMRDFLRVREYYRWEYGEGGALRSGCLACITGCTRQPV
ncbi:MAG: transposase [Treponema sp.]|nr:transposase [Treponema sp.]